MASYYWIKLYHEILHDPKMGRLPDNLWRRTIELFLMAGEQEEDGYLPDVPAMAWVLRIGEDQLAADLEKLVEHDIVELDDGRWYVTHFAERQKEMSSQERVARHRERKRKQEYYGTETPEQQDCNDTVTERYTDKSRVDKNREETESPPPAKPAKRKAESPPAAIQIFHANTQRYPVKSLYPDIEKAIGNKPADLEFWGDVVKNWLLMGWSKTNVKGMLDFYDRREIPPGNGKNGKSPPPREDTTKYQPVPIPEEGSIFGNGEG